MIAAVTDLGGTITGTHRTWLYPSGRDKVRIDTPRRAMGHLLGKGNLAPLAIANITRDAPVIFTREHASTDIVTTMRNT